MKKITISYIILVAVLSCTATFISVRESDNTTISTSVDQDSMRIGGGEWDLDRRNSISIDRNKDKRHYKNDSIK